MSAALFDRPAAPAPQCASLRVLRSPQTGVGRKGPLPGGTTTELDLDLRGHDYATRRRCLFAALRRLQPGSELVVVSSRPGDLRWLRYEMEARLDRRYRWSPSAEGGAGHTVIRPAA